ncbi:MAG: hypothetical protein Q7S39_12515 [Ignavibacteria bacterium]|nr:hypothetical protein [Ignavibacteria bacterium]
MNIRKLFTVLIVSIFISSLSFSQEKYGKEITLEEKTEISEIISDPSGYVGKKVLIEGEILAVCQMAG